MFTGKTVVVTGAAAGIGRTLALRLADQGADVWGLDLDAAALAILDEDGAKQGTKLNCRRADVTDLAALAAVRDEIAEAGKTMAVWVNNAGVAGIGDFLELGDEGFMRVLDVNVRGVINGTRIALQTMEEQGEGRIVNMASVAGHLPAPYMSAYCTSKHAVVGFTRSLQAELALKDSPVKVMMVCPGFVDTKIIAKGEKLGYPEWLSFMLATPESVVNEMLAGLKAGKDEVYPTFNGKLMRRMYRMFPRATVKSSKLMLMKSWKDLVTNRTDR